VSAVRQETVPCTPTWTFCTCLEELNLWLLRGFNFENFARGGVGESPKSTKFFNVFRYKLWPALAAKRNKIETNLIPHTIVYRHANVRRIPHPGRLAGQRDNSPPNMTPLKNKIGTVAETGRVSGRSVQILKLSTQAYRGWARAVQTYIGFELRSRGNEGKRGKFSRFFQSLALHSRVNFGLQKL